MHQGRSSPLADREEVELALQAREQHARSTCARCATPEPVPTCTHCSRRSADLLEPDQGPRGVKPPPRKNARGR
jgi:hypothetical protein